MRRKARKPAKWKDAALLQHFAETHLHDEVERWLVGPVWEQVRDNWHLGNDLHTHHIFHSGKRVDVYGNLIRVSSKAHHYLHKEPIGGTVACLWAVIERERAAWRKIDPTPWSDWIGVARDEWREAHGHDVLGWLQAKRDGGSVPSYYLDTVDAILETF